MPQAGTGWPHRGGGLPRGCWGWGGSWCLLYSKANNSPWLVRGEWGCPTGSPPAVYMPPRRKCVQIRGLATHPRSPVPWVRAFVFLARGSPFPQVLPPMMAGTEPCPPQGEYSLQHSVTTQYCISAINTNLKKTETQFSHQSQEQHLAGL